jgi:hypothetical protein
VVIKYPLLDLKSDDWFADAELIIRARELGFRIGGRRFHFKAMKRADFILKPAAIIEFTANLLKYRFGRRRIDPKIS